MELSFRNHLLRHCVELGLGYGFAGLPAFPTFDLAFLVSGFSNFPCSALFPPFFARRLGESLRAMPGSPTLLGVEWVCVCVCACFAVSVVVFLLPLACEAVTEHS